MKVISTEKFNTNNGWGFGGGVGTETVYDNNVVNRKGKAYYRHLPSSNFDNWYIRVKRDFDLSLPKKPVSGDTVMVFRNAQTHHQVVLAANKEVTKERIEECKAHGYKLIKKVVL